jgi:hypothetical protein
MNDFSDNEQAAIEVVRSVLDADPAIGPAELCYLRPNEDPSEDHFIIMVFGGERAFYCNKTTGQMRPVDLDDRGADGEQRLANLIESAKKAASRERLGRVYFVKHD